MDEVDVDGGWKTGTQFVSCVYFRSEHILSVVDSVPYAALAKAFSLIEATTKRIEKTTLLTSLLLLVIRRSAPGDYQSLLQTVYLCINRVGSIKAVYSHVTNQVAVESGLHWC